MYRRFLSTICISVSIPACGASGVSGLPDAWIGSHYGSCYASIENGMIDVYGEGYDSDVNIFMKRETYGSIEMILTSDKTSGSNAARTVFEKRRNGRWCVVLTSPATASLTAKADRSTASRPQEWVTVTQAVPDSQEIKVVYKWDERRAVYMPKHCYNVDVHELREFDCFNAYK
jgi:hypothetical protein